MVRADSEARALKLASRPVDRDTHVSRLRQPISGPDAVAMLLGAAALIVSQYWLGVVPSFTTWLVIVAIVQFVIQPLSTLLHELGHAGAVA
jgi:fatty acid desaturase